MVRNKLGIGGCETCRKRKIKCDGVKPVCRKCRHSKIECAGYELNNSVKFIVQTSRNVPRARKGGPVTGRSHLAWDHPDRSRCEDDRAPASRPATFEDTTVFADSSSYSENPRILSSPLFDTSMNELYLGHFQTFIFKLYLPMSFTVKPGYATHSQILRQLGLSKSLDFPDIVQQIAYAIGSLTIVNQYSPHHSQWLALESLRYYSLAVTTLRNALARKSHTVESLSHLAYGILLLAAYEVENGKYDAWEAHVIAVGSILRRIGPGKAAIVSAARVLFYYYSSHARIYQLLGKVKCEFLDAKWVQLYEPSSHAYMILRSRAIRAFVHDDVDEGERVYEMLLVQEKQSLQTLEQSDDRGSIMFRIETLTLLTIIAKLINHMESNWALATFQYLTMIESKLNIFNGFLALEVIGHSLEVTKEQRLWCLMKIRTLLNGSSADPEESSPNFTREISQEIVTTIES